MNTLTDWSPVDHARRHDPLLAAIRTGDLDRAAAALAKRYLVETLGLKLRAE